MRFAYCLLALAACNVFKDGTVSGRVESKGDAGTWVLEKGACYSGQRESYFGAIAHGPEGSGVAIKFVKDSLKGWTAVINKADTCKAGVEKSECKAIVLSANECKTLDVDLATTNTTVNDVRVVEGKATIDCASDTGSIKGELIFTHCH
jgi:hypothetical protein